jgi:hypothetical protein
MKIEGSGSALEEHWDRSGGHFTETKPCYRTSKRLYDLGQLRLKEMDEARIDIQVLSHASPRRRCYRRTSRWR